MSEPKPTPVEPTYEDRERTDGPWKIFETRHPHKFGGEHIERRIGTAWDHGQLKGPVGVVNMAYGVGPEGGKGVTFISISNADAHLIAAAPDLLEACRLALEPKADDPVIAEQRREIVRAAIAKAEGRQ